ncbi:hypothetical protein AB0C77_13845 [Streptomyces sp. NPDC048629]|uniref:hypothetical protein n=1 Tax=Streptomyces sp. NPDC048629 TaxID=3154824 RepID=UPI003414447D
MADTESAGTISVEPVNVAAFGRFLQSCAGPGGIDGGPPGIGTDLGLLQQVRISPGSPDVIPMTDALVATFGAVVKTLAETLQVFAQGLIQIGAELEQLASEYGDVEALAQAEIEDLGGLLAASEAFMQESGGRLATIADLAKAAEEAQNAAEYGEPTPATPGGTAAPATGEPAYQKAAAPKPAQY